MSRRLAAWPSGLGKGLQSRSTPVRFWAPPPRVAPRPPRPEQGRTSASSRKKPLRVVRDALPRHRGPQNIRWCHLRPDGADLYVAGKCSRGGTTAVCGVRRGSWPATACSGPRTASALSRCCTGWPRASSSASRPFRPSRKAPAGKTTLRTAPVPLARCGRVPRRQALGTTKQHLTPEAGRPVTSSVPRPLSAPMRYSATDSSGPRPVVSGPVVRRGVFADPLVLPRAIVLLGVADAACRSP